MVNVNNENINTKNIFSDSKIYFEYANENY